MHIEALNIGHFTCSQCKFVVRDPVECSECNALFCKDCVEEYIKTLEMEDSFQRADEDDSDK